MKYIICLLLFVFTLQNVEAKKKRPRMYLSGGAEYGWAHNKEIGNNYYQSSASLRFYGEYIYRYNGLNHFVISGGFSQDSLSFRNNNSYLTDISQGFAYKESFSTNALIKSKSVYAGGAYLLTIGKPMLGIDIQLGGSVKYMYEAVRNSMPDDKYEYALKDEIQPFNVLIQPKIMFRISYLRLGASYEIPIMDHINHETIINYLPYEHRSADMRGIRMDYPSLYLSASLVLPIEDAMDFISKAIDDYID